MPIGIYNLLVRSYDIPSVVVLIIIRSLSDLGRFGGGPMVEV